MVCQDSALSMGYGVDQDEMVQGLGHGSTFEMGQGVVLNIHIKTKISVSAKVLIFLFFIQIPKQ